jgi:RNase P subunit RPR2
MAGQETIEKTFKVTCVHCQKPFHVRFPLARPEVEGSGEVAVTCLYCAKNVKVTIPRKYIETDHLTRGIKSMAVEG